MIIAGTNIDLWSPTFSLCLGDVKLDPYLSHNPVVSVTQTDRVGKPSQFKATLFLRDVNYSKDEIFSENTPLSISMGYENLLVNKGYYFVAKPEFTFPSSGSASVTLKSIEKEYEKKNQGGKGRVFTGTTSTKVALLLAAENGWIPDVETFSENEKDIVQADNEDDITFLQRLGKTFGVDVKLEKKSYNSIDQKTKAAVTNEASI